MSSDLGPALAAKSAADRLTALKLANWEYGKGLTNEMIAYFLGTSRVATVAEWCSGRRLPSPQYVKIINTFLDQAKNKAWLEKKITSYRKQFSP